MTTQLNRWRFQELARIARFGMILQLKSILDMAPRFGKKFPSQQSIELFQLVPEQNPRDSELFRDSADC